MLSFNGYSDTLPEYNIANLRLSTSFRSNFNDPDTNCTINMTQNRIINNVCKLNLNSVTICNNFHNIATYNNRFILTVEQGNPFPTSYTIRVPPNYYTATALAAELQRLISVYAALTTVVWSDTLKRFVINTNDPGLELRFFVSNPNNFIGNNFLYIIGLPLDGAGYVATIVDSPFPYPPALFGATNVYIMSNKLVNAKSVLNVLGPNDSDIDRDLQSQNGSEIMSIGITAAYGSYNQYYDQGSDRGEYILAQGINLDSIDLRVVDQFGNVLQTDAKNTPIYYSFKVSYQ
jgi:hypothetical protein